MNSAQASEPGPIGLLYPGAMGGAVGTLLVRAGRRVVTTLAERGATTVRNCRNAGIEVLETLDAVVGTASTLLVLVPPDAASAVARRVRKLIARRPHGERLVYVDLNSVSPETTRLIAVEFADTEVDFVDGAISGPASRLETSCVLYLSGVLAPRIAGLFAGNLQVRVLGDLPGQASALRMLLSGMTKGVIAIFVEMALAARQAGILDPLLTAYQGSYPGIMEVVERTLPTYPAHAGRRGQELAEVERTLASLGVCPTVVPGIRELTVAMANCLAAADREKEWTVQAVIEALGQGGVLHA